MERDLNQIAALWKGNASHSFEELSQYVVETHTYAQGCAMKAINQMATLRNWLIGCYIVEFEQNGQDRAKYGSHLLSNLADRLQIKGLDRSMLNQCRTFYQRYPQICDSVNHKLKSIGEIKGLPVIEVISSADKENAICDSANHKFETDPDTLISKLSFTHIREIMTIEKRHTARLSAVRITDERLRRHYGQ